MGFEWLNDTSRKFLASGYLFEDETPEFRIRDICDKAEQRLGIEGFSDKMYDYMSRGWISLSSPVWSNYGREARGLPVSCVSGDTWINTLSGGGKQAKDITVGDMVLTHKGRYRPVTDIIPTKNREDIWKLKIRNRMTNLHLTGDHLVLTNRGWIRADALDPSVHLVAINDEIGLEEKPSNTSHIIDMLEYADYETVIVDGKICKAVENKLDRKALQHNINGTDFVSYYAQVPEKIELDEDLAWALGLFFAEGSLMRRKTGVSGFRVTLNKYDEQHVAEKFSAIIKDKFNISASIGYQKFKRNDGGYNEWMNVNCASKLVGNFFSSFGNGCKEKLIPDWIITADTSILHSFLSAMLLGDGSKNPNRDEWKITLSNPKLILQVYQICRLLGLGTSLQMQEKKGKLSSTSHVYTCIVRGLNSDVDNCSFRTGISFYDGLAYSKIETLEKTDKVLDVYDFTVEEDHSFSAAGVLLHNCFGGSTPDNVPGIMFFQSETGMLSKMGGGTSGYFGNIRPRGSAITGNGVTGGAVHFMQLFEKTTDVISQGGVRRGRMAPYLPIDHGDIEEFLDIGTEGNPIQSMTTGVTVSDAWMQAMIDGDSQKRQIWAKVLRRRKEIGFPYVMFSDTMNNNKPEVYKDKGMEIVASNLCSEISLPSNEEETFVCVLSSLNLEKYDEWQDTDLVETVIFFLDTVCQEMIEKLEAMRDSEVKEQRMAFFYMERAYNFVKGHRALGLGSLGYHSLLQKNMIPFESKEAKDLNIKIHKQMFKQSQEASKKLAVMFGEPEVLKGYGRRTTTTLAIAPTTSSAAILGQVSQSIEPWMSNNFIKNLAKMKVNIRNKYLTELLESKGQNTEEVWEKIAVNDGSVAVLDFLSDEEKSVFKTFREIDPNVIIEQAADRQKWLDQTQSLNLMLDSTYTPKEINKLMIKAWKAGVCTLYYQHSVNAAQQAMQSKKNEPCSACEA